MSKAAMNLQDSFLNQVRRENTEVKVLLVNGTGLRGVVKGFDNFTVILHNRNGQHLIYKHAIAQLVNQRAGGPRREGEEQGGREEGETGEAEAAPREQSQAAPSQQPAREQHGNARRDDHGHNQKPRKEGFNRLDLSSVRLASDNEVESK